MKLVLLRHGESTWNRENLFTGWADVDLSETGMAEADAAGALLRDEGYDFDLCFTSYLKRAIHTLNHALYQMDRQWLPVIKTWKLNERHYGALQGLNKAETAQKYGEDQVKLWRRSFDILPPPMDIDDPGAPHALPAYRAEPKEQLPLTESLKTTVERVVPYYEQEILPRIRSGQRVLIAAHGNSLRALVMYLDGLSREAVMELNIPTGVPLVYELDENLNSAGRFYLGDADAIAAKMSAVANQGKVKI